MHAGKIMCFATAMSLMACAVPSGQGTDSNQVIASSAVDAASDRPSGMEGAQASATELPSDACTQEGYWSFFEAFARSPKIRQTYTDDNVRDAINPFRIGLMDYQWVYVEADQGQARETLSLKETRSGNNFRVEYVRAEFGPDDEVVKTHGKPGVYEFQFKAGCWRLTNSIQ